MTEAMWGRIRDVPPYAKISRACELLGCARTKLYGLISDGSIRAVRQGGSTLVDMSSAMAFMSKLPQAEIGNRARRSVPI